MAPAAARNAKYDQHFYLTQGSAGQLQGYMIDEIRMSLSEWTAGITVGPMQR
jgi:hypothetical protein